MTHVFFRSTRKKKKRPSKGQAFFDKQTDTKRTKIKQFQEAETWCKSNNKGARACLTANPHLSKSSGEGGLISRGALEARLKGVVHTGKEYGMCSLLTELEEAQLVKWLIDCNLGRNGKNMVEIGHKVRDILLVRAARNRLGGRNVIPLSRHAQAIATGGGFPSQTWFARFFSWHGELLDLRKEQKIDSARAAVANEETLEEHFNGIWGLREELVDAGIMDARDGTIADPRRVLNRDETPQFIDYNDNKGNAKTKRAAGKNHPALSTSPSNRECVTVDITIGLDGFMYGVQFICARKTLTDRIITERLGEYFTGRIYEEKFLM